MAIDLTTYSRNRCVAWNTAEKKGVYSNDLLDDAGKPDPAKCALYGVDVAVVKPITVADLPDAYASGATAALAALASEWNMTPDDVTWHLVLNARLQDEANETVKAHRPVSDKAKERAYTTMVKSLAAAHGINEAEAAKRFADVLSALK